MDRWRRWRSRLPGSRADARRAWVSALTVFAVTAALAVLLAVRYHLAWPPVVVAILGTVPALYLALLAVPGVIGPPEPGTVKKPAYGRLVQRWDPMALGVHQVVGGGSLPAYVLRPHDELLRAVLDPAVPASRLVVIRGGSSTGKTRAAYEAVTARLAGWQLDYPLDPGALAARLEAGIPAGTVLWLGELRQYADADGGPAVLGRLADLLSGEGHLLITTMWPEQWNTYTAAARAGRGAADPAGTAGRLLERLPELTGSDPAGIDPARGGVIEVPDRFAAADLEAAARTGDPLLAAAAAAAASAGQVTQYLAGVPDLLDRYAGPGGDPYGQAVITAAMDAARLGHASPLPAALVQEAAVGYLTGPQRTKDIASWRETALAWAAAELNGAVQALQPLPPAAGTGVAGYQVADYLDQHGRRTRQDQLGPLSLWDALTAHAPSARDLILLGQAARDRGLYRHAAVLWTIAALGSMDAVRLLITHLRRVRPGDTTRAAHWVVSQASLDDPRAVLLLLRALLEVGADDAARSLATRAAGRASLDDPRAVAALLGLMRAAGADDAADAMVARDPAARAPLNDPWAVAALLRELRLAGDRDAAGALLARDPAAHAPLNDPQGVAALLRELRAAGADDAADALLTRDPAAHAPLNDPQGIADLLRELRAAGADDAADALLTRDPAAHASLADMLAVADLLRELRAAGADDAVTVLAIRAASLADLNIAPLVGVLLSAGDRDVIATLLARDPAGFVPLDDPQAVAGLLLTLRLAGADDAVGALLARDPAAHATLDDPQGVAALLLTLRLAGADDAVGALLARDPAAHASLDDPRAVAALLLELRLAGDRDAAGALLARDPAAHAPLNDPQGVADLLRELRAAGADDAAGALLARDPAAHAPLNDPQGVADLLRELRAAGADDAAGALLARDPAAHAPLNDQRAVFDLLRELRAAGDRDAARSLATRAAHAGMFSLFLEVYPDEASSYLFGREPDGTPSQSWEWQEPTSQNRGLRIRQPGA